MIIENMIIMKNNNNEKMKNSNNNSNCENEKMTMKIMKEKKMK